jgi:hypothetical protein
VAHATPARRSSTLPASEARLIITDDNVNVSDQRSAAVMPAEDTSASSSRRSPIAAARAAGPLTPFRLTARRWYASKAPTQPR